MPLFSQLRFQLPPRQLISLRCRHDAIIDDCHFHAYFFLSLSIIIADG